MSFDFFFFFFSPEEESPESVFWAFFPLSVPLASKAPSAPTGPPAQMTLNLHELRKNLFPSRGMCGARAYKTLVVRVKARREFEEKLLTGRYVIDSVDLSSYSTYGLALVKSLPGNLFELFGVC